MMIMILYNAVNPTGATQPHLKAADPGEVPHTSLRHLQPKLTCNTKETEIR